MSTGAHALPAPRELTDAPAGARANVADPGLGNPRSLVQLAPRTGRQPLRLALGWVAGAALFSAACVVLKTAPWVPLTWVPFGLAMGRLATHSGAAAPRRSLLLLLVAFIVCEAGILIAASGLLPGHAMAFGFVPVALLASDTMIAGIRTRGWARRLVADPGRDAVLVRGHVVRARSPREHPMSEPVWSRRRLKTGDHNVHAYAMAGHPFDVATEAGHRIQVRVPPSSLAVDVRETADGEAALYIGTRVQLLGRIETVRANSWSRLAELRPLPGLPLVVTSQSLSLLRKRIRRTGTAVLLVGLGALVLLGDALAATFRLL